jgi:hypothetical protein
MDLAAHLAKTFDALGVAYFLTGSLASSTYGEPRATRDVDIVADLRPADAIPLVAALGEGFYADVDVIEEAIARRGRFNLLDLESLIKIDVFLPTLPSRLSGEFSRVRDLEVPGHAVQTVRVIAPEDLIVAKLGWFRAGGEVSDQQWRDVVRILTLQSGRLDEDLLDREASAHDLEDLLDRAREDARI